MAKFKVMTLHDNSEPEVEAITFDELVQHGLTNGANVVDGMPWSFHYNGHPITHENDECYLIPSNENNRMTPNDILILLDGELSIMNKDLFEVTHKPV